MKFKIWNKKEDINNIEAKHFITNLSIRNDDEVFLVLDDYDNVKSVEIGRIIKSVYSMNNSLSIEDVAKEYIRIKEEEKLQVEKETRTLGYMENKISILNAENIELRKELNQIKTSIASLIATTIEK